MTLSKPNHAAALQAAATEADDRAFRLWLEYVALDELASYQAATAKKTADARDAKRAEAMVEARKRGEVLR